MHGRCSADTYEVVYLWSSSRPSDEEVLAACRACVGYWEDTRVGNAVHDDEHPLWWGAAAVMTARLDPELLWRVIQKLCATVDPASASSIGMIGVGPVEDLIRRDGTHAMDLLEAEADRDPIMLTALESVWCNEPARSRLDALLARHGREPSAR
jgi:hypothetical protein